MTDRRKEIERLVWDYGSAVHFYGNQGDKVAAAMDAVSTAIDSLLVERDALSEKLRLVDAHSGGTLDQFAALVRDAERYRWLRAKERYQRVRLESGEPLLCEEMLDAAIDAAIAAREKP